MSIRRDGTIHIEIQERGADGITVVDVAGVVDTSTTLTLDERLTNLLRDGRYRLVVNMADVTYVSSAGWGLFISLLQKTREQGGDIKLAALSNEVRNVFNLLAFSNLIASYKSVDEAVAAFGHD
mgnify:CR=1 FL=1